MWRNCIAVLSLASTVLLGAPAPAQAAAERSWTPSGNWSFDTNGRRCAAARSYQLGKDELTLGFDELLRELLTRAASSTGAQAVAVRVKGPGGAPVTASLGTVDETTLLDATLRLRSESEFSAMTVGWAYPATGSHAAAFQSAIVVPLVEHGVATGALGSYAYGPDAFLPEHLRALQSVANDAAAGGDFPPTCVDQANGIDHQARWMWFNPGGVANPFRSTGTNTFRAYLIFRLPAVEIPIP